MSAVLDGLQPWNGCWRLPSKDDLTDGAFYTLPQFTAKQLLQARAPRSQWEGDFLQAVLLHKGPLSPAQDYWLTRLVQEHEGSERRAA